MLCSRRLWSKDMWSVAVAVLALVCGFANAAYAGTKTVVRTETYAVAGKNGEALMKAMNLKGPSMGFWRAPWRRPDTPFNGIWIGLPRPVAAS